MSRGFGKLQNECLRALTANQTLSVLEVAWFAFDVQPNEHGRFIISEAQRAATARALLGLQKRGMAFAVHRTHGGGFLWAKREAALASIDRAVRAFGRSGASGYGKALIDAWAATPTSSS